MWQSWDWNPGLQDQALGSLNCLTFQGYPWSVEPRLACCPAGSGFRVPAQPQMSISSLAPTAAPKPGVCACIPSCAVGQIRKEERRETKTGTEKYKETERGRNRHRKRWNSRGTNSSPMPPSLLGALEPSCQHP